MGTRRQAQEEGGTRSLEAQEDRQKKTGTRRQTQEDRHKKIDTSRQAQEGGTRAQAQENKLKKTGTRRGRHKKTGTKRQAQGDRHKKTGKRRGRHKKTGTRNEAQTTPLVYLPVPVSLPKYCVGNRKRSHATNAPPHWLKPAMKQKEQQSIIVGTYCTSSNPPPIPP